MCVKETISIFQENTGVPEHSCIPAYWFPQIHIVFRSRCQLQAGCHKPGEDVEPAGRGFRIGGSGQIRRQVETFHQRNDIDAAGLENGAVRQIELVQVQHIQPFVDAALGFR